MQKYGVKCDAEELDMLDTAARQLEVYTRLDPLVGPARRSLN
jgi:hypothetical protein